jgi:hypothetical protein
MEFRRKVKVWPFTYRCITVRLLDFVGGIANLMAAGTKVPAKAFLKYPRELYTLQQRSPTVCVFKCLKLQ